jgi:hypothetical protein
MTLSLTPEERNAQGSGSTLMKIAGIQKLKSAISAGRDCRRAALRIGRQRQRRCRNQQYDPSTGSGFHDHIEDLFACLRQSVCVAFFLPPQPAASLCGLLPFRLHKYEEGHDFFRISIDLHRRCGMDGSEAPEYCAGA